MKALIFLLFIITSLSFSQEKLSEAIDLVNSGKLDEANSAISDFLRKHHNDHRGNYVKAVILSQKGKYGKALANIGTAISAKPDMGEYYQLEAQLYESTNKPLLAIQSWEKCQKHSKGSQMFVEAKNHIDFLKEE